MENRGRSIIGNAVTEWDQKCMEVHGEHVPTLVRSATIAHGEEICKAFQAQGIDFRQGTVNTNAQDSAALIEGFRRGDFIGLVSVSKFERGFDVPFIRCLSDQRPLRKSLASEIQFLGRGMRADSGKVECVVLDHCSNFISFQDAIYNFWENGVSELSSAKHREATRQEPKDRADIVCQCGFVYPRGALVCPSCGNERPRKSGVAERAGNLMEVMRLPSGKKWGLAKQETWQQIAALAMELKHGDYDSAKKFALAHYRTLFGEWPPYAGGFEPAPQVEDVVRRKVRQQIVVWRKSKR